MKWPAINQLSLRVQRDVLRGKKLFARGVPAAKQIRPVFIRAQRTVRGGLEQQQRVVHQVRHQREIVLRREVGVGVIAQDGCAEQRKRVAGRHADRW